MSLNIRTARKSDLTHWIGMRSELWPASKGDHPADLSEYFAGRSTDIVEAFVLETGQGEIVGFIELNIRSFAEGSLLSRVPYVEAWFVRPAFRGKGYGKALMKRAEAWAIQGGLF